MGAAYAGAAAGRAGRSRRRRNGGAGRAGQREIDPYHFPDMDQIAHVTACFNALCPMSRFILTEIAKGAIKDLLWPLVRSWLGRTWRRLAVPALRRWRRRIGSAVRSALRAMPPMLPILPPAQSR